MDPISVHRHVELDASLDDLWELIADPAHLEAWLGDSDELDLTPGGTGMVLDDGVRRLVHVDLVEHRRAIGFTWWEQGDAATPSRVVFEIGEVAGGGVRLDITEKLAPSIDSLRANRAADRTTRWEVRVCALWACTVVAALVP